MKLDEILGRPLRNFELIMIYRLDIEKSKGDFRPGNMNASGLKTWSPPIQVKSRQQNSDFRSLFEGMKRSPRL